MNFMEIDLSNESFNSNPNLSVLANSVDYLNSILARSVDSGLILEVGCGTQSVFKDLSSDQVVWQGIDVVADEENTIATQIASVSAIPFDSNHFDLVLSNQSIEHWHEYGVTLNEGVAEIYRVLKPGGVAVINFPVHLHGHRIFVKGNLSELEMVFSAHGFSVGEKIKVIDSNFGCYKGWRKCGFPDWYVGGAANKTAYVAEYRLIKPSGDKRYLKKNKAPIKNRSSSLARNLHHGVIYFCWKIWKRYIG